jgi:hypothetical protein
MSIQDQESESGGLTQRKELELKAEQYINVLQSEIKSLGKDAKKIGTTTLVIGGIFLAVYLIGRKIKKKKSKPFNDPSLNQLVVAHPKKESPIVAMIKEHITLFLIALIKEKLMTYLKESGEKHEPVQ